MVEQIVTVALTNGRLEFAILIVLVIYVLKVNSDREKKYQEIITGLTSSVNKVEKIEGEVVELGKKVDKLNDNLSDRLRR